MTPLDPSESLFCSPPVNQGPCTVSCPIVVVISSMIPSRFAARSTYLHPPTWHSSAQTLARPYSTERGSKCLQHQTDASGAANITTLVCLYTLRCNTDLKNTASSPSRNELVSLRAFPARFRQPVIDPLQFSGNISHLLGEH